MHFKEDTKMPSIQEEEAPPTVPTPRNSGYTAHFNRPTPTVPTPKNSNFSTNFNRYTPAVTVADQVAGMPSAAIPKTTGANIGRTPYVGINNLKKRKLDFENQNQNSPIKMSPNKKTTAIISQSMKDGMNFWFFVEHPDGWISSYTARGRPNGKAGWVSSAFLDAARSLQNTTRYPFAQQAMLSSVLPRVDGLTGLAKVQHYQKKNNETGQYEPASFVWKSFVHHKMYLPDKMTVEEWAQHQVDFINNTYSDLKLVYGGNALEDGSTTVSLDSEFIAGDVASLVMAMYEDSVKDGSFFSNQTLLRKYFRHTTDVVGLFQELELI